MKNERTSLVIAGSRYVPVVTIAYDQDGKPVDMAKERILRTLNRAYNLRLVHQSPSPISRQAPID